MRIRRTECLVIAIALAALAAGPAQAQLGQVTIPILDPTSPTGITEIGPISCAQGKALVGQHQRRVAALQRWLAHLEQQIAEGWDLIALDQRQELRDAWTRSLFEFMEMAQDTRAEIAEEEQNVEMGTAALEAAGC